MCQFGRYLAVLVTVLVIFVLVHAENEINIIAKKGKAADHFPVVQEVIKISFFCVINNTIELQLLDQWLNGFITCLGMLGFTQTTELRARLEYCANPNLDNVNNKSESITLLRVHVSIICVHTMAVNRLIELL